MTKKVFIYIIKECTDYIYNTFIKGYDKNDKQRRYVTKLRIKNKAAARVDSC